LFIALTSVSCSMKNRVARPADAPLTVP
jgi:hypothetical protein